MSQSIRNFLMNAALEDSQLPLEHTDIEHCDMVAQQAIQDQNQLMAHAGPLAELTDRLEEVQEGSLTDREQAFVQASVESHFQLFGGQSLLTSVTGMEDATVSMELLDKVGETLKNFWNAIRRTIRTLIQNVKLLFDKIFSNVRKLKARNTALIAALRKLDGSVKPKEEVDVPAIANITFKNEVSMKAMLASMQASRGVGAALFKKFLPEAANYYKQYAMSNNKLMRELPEYQKRFESTPEETNKHIATVLDEGAEKALEKIMSDMNKDHGLQTNNASMPGDWGFPNTLSQLMNGRTGGGIVLARFHIKGDAPTTDARIKTPKPVEVEELLNIDGDIIDNISSKQQITEQVRKAKEQATEEVDKLVDSLDKHGITKFINKQRLHRHIRGAAWDLSGAVSNYCAINFRAIITHHKFANNVLAAYGSERVKA